MIEAYGHGRFISQPGRSALLIDLDYESKQFQFNLFGQDEEDFDKLQGFRFIGMLNSSELFLEGGYEWKEDSYADGPCGVARWEYQQRQLRRDEDIKWAEKNKKTCI